MSSQLMVSAAPAVIELARKERAPLSVEWVDFLFSKLQLKYGDKFLGGYKTVKVSVLRAEWAEELNWFGGNEGAVLDFALSNLPEAPPNIVEFKRLCKQWRPIGQSAEVHAMLAAPKQASKGAAMFRRWRDRADVRPSGDSLEPARALMRRELSGEPVTLVQREYWRQALRRELKHQTGIDVGLKFDLGELALALKGYEQTMQQHMDEVRRQQEQGGANG